MKIKKLTQINRRDALAIILGTAGALALSSNVYASKDKLSKRIDKITNNKGAKETDLFLDVPEIAENGNQVKVNFEIDSPMSQNDYIKFLQWFHIRAILNWLSSINDWWQ